MAIEQALTILSWHENVTKDEVPPEYLWEDSEGLEMWWASVKDKRELPYRSSSSGSDERPSELEENELARAFRDG